MPVGRPKVPKAGRSRTAGRLDSPRKPNYRAILEQHEAAGRTSRIYAANSQKSVGTVRRKVQRFCYAELKTTEEEFLENLTAGRVKTYFDWVEDTHRNSIKAASAFDSYWRVLKILYVERTGHGMDSGMEQDCLNYKNVVIKRWGLRRRRRRGTSGTKDDVYRILHAHWTRCTKAYADEKQRLYVAAGILLSFISGARLVSLFDTRIKTGDAEAGDGQSKGVSHTASRGSKNRTNRRRHRPRATGPTPDRYPTAGSGIGQHGNRPIALEKRKWALSDDDEEYRDTKKARIMAPRKSCRSAREEASCGKYGMRGEDVMYDPLDSDMDSHMSNDTDSDSGYVDEESDSTSGSSEEPLFGELVRENDTDTESSAESVESGCTSDTSADNDISELDRFIEDVTDDEKTFISHNPEPLLDLLGHFLSMAIDDEIFAPEFEKLEDIYWYPIPSYLGGMSLKIKAEMLDVPVFRQPERTGDGYRTSEKTPLKGSTWSGYLRHLRLVAGFKYSLTQYVWRRSLINAINNKAPSSVRDQVADHESNAVRYYLDTVIRFDLEAAAMELPSNDVVQKAAHGLFLNADATAPTELTDELKRKITENPKIIELTERSKELTRKLRAMGFRSVPAARGKTPLYEEKMKVVSRLNRSKVYLHSKLIERQRRWHFRHADTERFNQRLRNGAGGGSLDECPAPPPLQISERRRVVELTCAGTQELTEDEQFARRCACIIVWFKLQRRKEVQRRGRHKKHQPSQRDFQPDPPLDTVRAKESIPAKLGEKQCPFCVADTSLPWGERMKVRERTNKFWNHIESVHREELKAYSTGQKHCGICKVQGVTFTPPSIMEFKSHTLSVHGPRLRA
ncbi:predicted protein [Histoplasma mississippiense (nom. inval.)]|uniref:predicted protein n=1 Tax=Ajellomyces capsulatus (strain NAm1 / WU24) TaxID=2059318 RepID=UPI000157B772|nr:predicted protein [Histoplasma mississippiense (nom. inval.)]EDN03883.1 predicted protein [Histoplasma mississippiense (nom. inval.)]